MITVGQLKEALREVPDDTPLALAVYGHLWVADEHTISHGEAEFTLAERSNRWCGRSKVALIWQSCAGFPHGLIDPATKADQSIVDDFKHGNYARRQS